MLERSAGWRRRVGGSRGPHCFGIKTGLGGRQNCWIGVGPVRRRAHGRPCSTDIRHQILAPPLSCAIARRQFSFPPSSPFTYVPATVLQRTARPRRDSFLLAVCPVFSSAFSDTGSPTRARPICHRFYARENHLTHPHPNIICAIPPLVSPQSTSSSLPTLI